MIQIGKFTIENNRIPFTIAEAGINHNGILENAYKMIEVAVQAEVNAIKFQTFKAEEFIKDTSLEYIYKSQGQLITEPIFNLFKRCEFTREEWFLIKKKCEEEKIIFLSTPQNKSDLELLLELGISAIKVGSDDFTNLPLLRNYSKTGLPMILSCGMSNLSEIYLSLSEIKALDGYPTILMLCTSQYPTSPEDVNLNKFMALKAAFPDLILGFSDHTEGSLASSVAVAFGAIVFEKHFTLDKNLAGPDHWFSEDPIGLKNWNTAIKTAYAMLGSRIVRATKQEEDNKKEFRRVIVAVKSIKCGAIIDENSLGMKRTNEIGGIPSFFFDFIVGKEAKKNYNPGDIINF